MEHEKAKGEEISVDRQEGKLLVLAVSPLCVEKVVLLGGVLRLYVRYNT